MNAKVEVGHDCKHTERFKQKCFFFLGNTVLNSNVLSVKAWILQDSGGFSSNQDVIFNLSNFTL